MPKYKLQEVPIGGFIYLTDNNIAYRADDRDEAIKIIQRDCGDDRDLSKLESLRLTPRVVYKRDIDDGEFEFEDVEPGQTWYEPSPQGVLFWTAPYATPNPPEQDGDAS